MRNICIFIINNKFASGIKNINLGCTRYTDVCKAQYTQYFPQVNAKTRVVLLMAPVNWNSPRAFECFTELVRLTNAVFIIIITWERSQKNIAQQVGDKSTDAHPRVVLHQLPVNQNTTPHTNERSLKNIAQQHGDKSTGEQPSTPYEPMRAV